MSSVDALAFGPEAIERSFDDLDIDIAQVVSHLETGEEAAQAALSLERIVLGHHEAITQTATKFKGEWHLTKLDFFQAGVEGVYDALARIDASMPAKAFTTYARYRIFDYMFRLSAEGGGAVSITQGGLKRVIRARRVQVGLEKGDLLPDLLYEQKLSSNQYRVYSLVGRLRNALSLEREVDDEEELTFLTSADNNEPSHWASDPAEQHEVILEEALVRKAVASLPERQREIVVKHYGFDNHERRTLAKIGEEFGLTESRICQIIGEARKRLTYQLTRDD